MEPRLAGHFPKKKGCEKQASVFFGCLSEQDKLLRGEVAGKADQEGSALAGVGRSALKACAGHMAKYDKCMERSLKKHPLRFERVAQAYRRDYSTTTTK
jgi:hypothetical protein